MNIQINFRKKEIYFIEEVSREEMISYMNNYFPTDTWGDFKFIASAGINEEPDIGWRAGLSIGDG